MGYGCKFPANQLGSSKNVWPMREYGLYLVCVRRELTVVYFSDYTIVFYRYVFSLLIKRLHYSFLQSRLKTSRYDIAG